MIPLALATVLDLFTAGELDGAAASFSEDATYQEPRKAPIRGREAIAAEFARYAEGGVPFRVEVEELIVDGNRACVAYTFKTGGGEGQPWRERAGCATVRFDEGGRIAAWREYDG
ncbi:MAG TPA: nuclear transport factor 2 family protein [Candidatus Elarobacter sp.]|jgi:ketosteroid isomerase-like protein|nr:nuclear transport factor 2 family protein [Candidatus Elarobacter sp.]